ncbi:MAG TPA: TylF/MycF/NovP-related O-methyltransferase [Caulobacteraceae bacterium]
MWTKTPFDAPDNQIYGISSEKDKAFWAGLQSIFGEFPHSQTHILAHWPVYTKRILLTRFLAHYELFKQTLDIPGSIVELGVSRGVSFFTWHKLLEIFAPMDTSKRVFGFDSFEGLTDFGQKDGVANTLDTANDKQEKGWSAENVEGEIFALADLTNADNVLARQRSRLIKGRVQDTLDPFLAETPGLRISLLHFDLDLYDPTLYTLERLWDLVVPGGIVIFDEYALPPWGGEAAAWDEFARSRGLKVEMKKLPWCLTPTGYVKKTDW